MFIADVLISTP